MKKIMVIVLLVIAFKSEIISQAITVLETNQIINSNDGEFYFPHFSRDDSEIIFSTSNYIGLFRTNIKNKNISQITNENGAGYNPLVLDVSDDLIYKSFVLKDGRKFKSLKRYNLKLDVTNVIEQNKRILSLPSQTSSNKVTYKLNSSFKAFTLPNAKLLKDNIEPKELFVENDQLYLMQNNVPNTFSPLGEGVYVWESFSKDGKKIIFSFGNKGTFVCNLNGKVLINIPKAHYPKISPNGKYLLYMIDEDNGHSYIASDIFIYSFAEDKSYKVTNTKNKIEMYAEWSNKGNSIVYHTEDGEIYITKLDIEK